MIVFGTTEALYVGLGLLMAWSVCAMYKRVKRNSDLMKAEEEEIYRCAYEQSERPGYVPNDQYMNEHSDQ